MPAVLAVNGATLIYCGAKRTIYLHPPSCRARLLMIVSTLHEQRTSAERCSGRERC